jgi:glutamate synthase (NADPH) small chain
VRDRFLDDLGLGYNDRGAIPAVSGFGTEEPGIFVAGDAKRGASLIVWAIAEGRKAARQADGYLMGESMLPG